jgi:hypothetical protein
MRCAKFGIALLAVILAGCLVHLWALDRCITRTSEQLTAACTLAQENALDDATHAAQAAQESWENARGFLGAVLRHAEADDLSYAFARLPNYATAENAFEFCAICDELISRLAHIQDSEHPRFYNFL